MHLQEMVLESIDVGVSLPASWHEALVGLLHNNVRCRRGLLGENR